MLLSPQLGRTLRPDAETGEYNRAAAMLKGALLATGLLLLAVTAEPLYHAATNRRQITVTCDAFAQSPPRARWLRVTGCEVDYVGAGIREWRGRIVELYFPARPVGWRPTDPAPLVATTRDPSVLALAQETIGGARTPDQEEFLVMMLKIVTALRAAREIEGYGKASLLERLGARNALAGLSTPLSPKALIVDLHARPRLLGPAAAAAAGVLLIAASFVVRSTRRRDVALAGPAEREGQRAVEGQPAQAADAPQPPGPLPPDSQPAADVAPAAEPGVASATPLRLMLLNLPPDAGREAIEDAPPLGSRADIIAALAGAVPGLRFDLSGNAAIGRADYLIVDIGRSDPVYTAVLHARGAAALPMVRRILDRTGWRAFEPKTGVFIAADRLGDYRNWSFSRSVLMANAASAPSAAATTAH